MTMRMHRVLPMLLVMIAAAALIVAGCGDGSEESTAMGGGGGTAMAAGPDSPASYDLLGKPAPEFTAANLDGDEIALKDYLGGQVVLLSLWSADCAVSEAAMPEIASLVSAGCPEGCECDKCAAACDGDCEECDSCEGDCPEDCECEKCAAACDGDCEECESCEGDCPEDCECEKCTAAADSADEACADAACGDACATCPMSASSAADGDLAKAKMLTVYLGDDGEAATGYLEKTGLSYPVILDADGAIKEAYMVTTTPQTVLIGTDGTIQAIHVGWSGTNLTQLTTQIDQVRAGEDIAEEAVQVPAGSG